MIRCNNCGTDNLDGSEYCDECGMKLDIAPRSPRTRDGSEPALYQPPKTQADSESQAPNRNHGAPVGANTVEGVPPAPPSFTTSTSIPKPATPVRSRVSDPGGLRAEPVRPAQTLVLSSRGNTDALRSDASNSVKANRPAIDAKLILERGGRVGKEFPITNLETNIGRWDADSGIFPDVDLDQDDPEAKVSRRHARIVFQNGQFFIEDLGSTNGTFVNRGRRLLPGHRQILQNGDEIIVGKTFLKLQVSK